MARGKMPSLAGFGEGRLDVVVVGEEFEIRGFEISQREGGGLEQEQEQEQEGCADGVSALYG